MNYKVRIIKYKLLKQLATYCLLPIAYCLLLPSCKDKQDVFNIDYQYNYYPLDTTHYIIYNVDSILYTYNGQHHNDTAHYQLKEIVADTTYDNVNELSYIIEFYRRADDNSPWVFDRRWTAKKTTNNFQKIEDDIRFVKLIFPPKEADSWDGNLYVPTSSPFDIFKNWNYHYQNVGVPYSVNGFSFDSTLTVVDVYDSTLITKRLRKEVYAKGIGKIYEEYELVATQDVHEGLQNPQTGFSIRMKIKSHYP